MTITRLVVVTLSLSLTVSGRQADPLTRVFFTEDGKLLQEFLSADGEVTDCDVYADRSTSQEILSEVPSKDQHLVTAEEFKQKVEACHKLVLKSPKGTSPNRLRKRSVLKGIYPGTLWCGRLNVADGEDDLGTLKAEDSCCRAHDKCTPKIPVDQTAYGLTNEGPFTAFHCETCDRVFYDCLKSVNSFHSNVIGATFFDVIGSTCFEEDYPLVCTTKWFFFESCERDTTQPKVMQFKDFPDSYIL